jgi:hypothetical protein
MENVILNDKNWADYVTGSTGTSVWEAGSGTGSAQIGGGQATNDKTIASNGSIASAYGAVALGYESEATGDFSFSVNSAYANGTNSSAFGSGRATGEKSLATGNGTQAIGGNSFAAGSSTLATELNSIATGGSTRALSQYSIANGNGTVAAGNKSVVNGNSNFAGGNNSSVEGNENLIGFYFDNGVYVASTKTLTFTGVDLTSHFGAGGYLSRKTPNYVSQVGKISSVDYTGGDTHIIMDDTDDNFFPITFAYDFTDSIISYSDSIYIGNAKVIGSNNICQASDAFIGGSENMLLDTAINSAIIGGSNITGDTADTLYCTNLEIPTVAGTIIMTSADGTRYKVTMQNGGTLAITAA